MRKLFSEVWGISVGGKNLRVAIYGATGYTGFELYRILKSHPFVSEIVLKGRRTGRLSDFFPSVLDDAEILHLEERDEAEVVFLALPHTVSMKYVPGLSFSGKKVIDLSADYRFSEPKLYELAYGVKHEDIANLSRAVYGIPEFFKDDIRKAQIVGNPGCYPTSVLIPLLPLAAESLIDEFFPILVDSKSGVSGAGRKAKENLHFPELYDSFSAYGVWSHRHQPEMQHILNKVSQNEYKVRFVPHLAPMSRGILSTIYFRVKDVEASSRILRDFYENASMVSYVEKLPATKDVRGTNNLLYTFKNEGRDFVVVSVIDNLVRGASGQAVENMNILLGFPENAGLSSLPFYP